MIKSLSKVLVVTAMLFAFVGQALAYSAMSCEMSEQSHQSHQSQVDMNHSSMSHSDMDHSNMSHSGMDHSSMSHGTESEHEECCGADCVCPTSACSTVIIVSSQPNTANLTRLNEGVVFQLTNQTKSIPTSLYRPPIFA